MKGQNSSSEQIKKKRNGDEPHQYKKSPNNKD
jgi:hypothetical protein